MLVTWGEDAVRLVSCPMMTGVDGDVSTSSTSPILPGSISILAGTTLHGSGADTAPSGIVVHSWTTLDTTLVVHLAGEIDHFSAAPLRMMLSAAAANGFTGLVLDTSRVTFCDSGLLAVLRWWPQQGRRLRLATRSPAVQHLLNAAAATARQPDPSPGTQEPYQVTAVRRPSIEPARQGFRAGSSRAR